MRARILAIGVLLLCLVPLLGQESFNEREVKSQSSPLDKAEVWSLDFRFKDPRIIKVNLPGRGTRIYWYLWYQVVNRTPEPRRFSPIFELVTLDQPAVYKDNNFPVAEEAIKKVEDPTGYQNIKNVVTISENPIPVSLPEAFPKAVTGVAIWEATPTDSKKRDKEVPELSDTTRFRIFVRGLSNGFVIVDALAPGQPPITRFKTLQLNFRRTGDRYSLDSRDISFVPPAEWIYRAGSRTIFDTDK
jgi:hypothetical protein